MKLNIIARERLSNGFLKIEALRILLPNQKVIVREVIKKPDAVAVLAITKNGEVFLTKQPRAGINNLESIEIPAGLIDDGESPEMAAERELLEETGCELSQKLIPLGSFVSDPACSTSVTHLFLALKVRQVKNQNLDEDEYLECFKETIKETYRMLENGAIIDANSIIALERAKKYFSLCYKEGERI